MLLRVTSDREFVSSTGDDPGDSFAKTFAAKANMQKIWGHCIGAWQEERLLGAVITTISKRKPKVANLQLLHVFAAHRFGGVGRTLCEYSLRLAKHKEAKYFRVSAEPGSVDFYRKCGFKFWGPQKSGCWLCMFRLDDMSYDIGDPVIDKALFSGRKGSLAASWKKG